MPNKRKQRAEKKANPEKHRHPLVKQIYLAFEDMQYPSELVRQAGLDPKDDVYGGQHWTAVIDEVFQKLGLRGKFLIEETRWFYLPACMVEMVEHPDDIMEARFMGTLIPPTISKHYLEILESTHGYTHSLLQLYQDEEFLEKSKREFQMRDVARFNQQQRKVIADFLHWYAENGKGLSEEARTEYSMSSGFWYHQ